MLRFFLLTVLVLAPVVAVARAQPLEAPRPDDNAAEVYLRLHDTRESREIRRIASLQRDRMAFVPERYAEITVGRAMVVLKLERRFLDALLDTTRLERYEIRPSVPSDPCTHTTDETRPEYEGIARAHARALSYAAVRRWEDEDYDGAADCAAGILRMSNQLAGTGDILHAMTASVISGDLANTLLDEMGEVAGASPEPIRFSPKAVRTLRDAVEARSTLDPAGIVAASVSEMRLKAAWFRHTFANEENAPRFIEYVRHYGRSQAEMDESMGKSRISHTHLDELIRRAGNDLDAFSREVDRLWDELPKEERRAAIAEARRGFEKYDFDPDDFVPRVDPDNPPTPQTAAEIAARLDEVASLLDRLAAAGTRDEVEAAFDAIWTAVEEDETQLARVCCGLVRGQRNAWRYSLTEHARTLDLIARLARLGE